MTSLEKISSFSVPADLVAQTDEQLRAAGQDGVERFVLWSGVQHVGAFRIRTAHVPKQTAYKTERGLYVEVTGDELHRLNVWLYEHGELLAIQVHSHPTEAFHSDLDDSYPMVTLPGALSIVVPDFAHEGLRGPGVACYRLDRHGWSELTDRAFKELVSFESI